MVRHGGCRFKRCGVLDPPHLTDIRMTAIAAEIERFNRLSATWWDALVPTRSAAEKFA
jgi:hypothetical protein